MNKKQKRISMVIACIMLVGTIVVLITAIKTYMLNKEPFGLIMAVIQFLLFLSLFLFICKYPLQIEIDPEEIRKTWKIFWNKEK